MAEPPHFSSASPSTQTSTNEVDTRVSPSKRKLPSAKQEEGVSDPGAPSRTPAKLRSHDHQSEPLQRRQTRVQQ